MTNIPPAPSVPGMNHSPRIIVRSEEAAPGAPVVIEHHYHVMDPSQIPGSSSNPQIGSTQVGGSMGLTPAQSSAALATGPSSWNRCVVIITNHGDEHVAMPKP
mmetsp:Transcript_8334/g.15076  ORF Transcript_8334/g.15076 Transcript_8334/m.15076 type:complete len:103 (+) Transcript_8334:61-369(+)